MLVRRIRMEGFMNHADTVLELPERGVTVLWGPNGAGKSALIEAVSYAWWGKTLRGTTPWAKKRTGLVEVETDLGSVSFGTKLSWTRPGGEVVKLDRKSGTRDAIIQEVGDHDLWRKTSVFSSADASHFSGAGDKGRKELVEAVLGFDIFDRGLAYCRADIVLAKEELDKVERELESLESQLAAVKMVLEYWQETPPFEPGEPPEKPEYENRIVDGSLLTELQSELAELQGRRAAANQRVLVTVSSEVTTATAAARSALQIAETRVKRAKSGRCVECDRPFKKSDVREAERLLGLAQADLRICEEREVAARDEVVTERATANVEVAAIDERFQKVQIDAGRVHQAMGEVGRYHRNLVEWETREAARKERWESNARANKAKKDKARANLAELKEQIEEVMEFQEQVEEKLEELRAAEKALGLQGVRVGVLSRVLVGVEHVANGWLQSIPPYLQIRLRPYTELKGGGTNDKLDLLIEGAGGGEGYKAASGGERRRVDAAILLALAEIAAAARNCPSDSTLFLDEVFDAVDDEGCEAVADCITELGERRSVVLITHRRELADRVNAAQRFAVEGGRLT